jgi:hypothetical protein
MSNPTTPTNPYQGLTKEQVITTMLQLQADEERNPFLMGQLYNYVAGSQLLKSTQYNTPMDFFCDKIQGISRTALPRYGAVAREFSQEVIARFGITRLELLLAYKQGSKITLNSSEPGSTFIVVPQDNGDLKPKLFADCSTRELRKAMEHLRSPSSYLPISPANRARYDWYREVILRHFPKGVRVLMRNHEGTTLIDFEGVPLSEVNKLIAVLREQPGGVSEEPEAEEAPQPN